MNGERMARQPRGRPSRGHGRVRLVHAPAVSTDVDLAMVRRVHRTPAAPSAERARAPSGSPTWPPGAAEAYAELHINCLGLCGRCRCWSREAGGFTNDFFAGDGVNAPATRSIATNAALAQ
jgi:hypothetical protein